MLKQLICWLKTGHKNRWYVHKDTYLRHWLEFYKSYPPFWVNPNDKFYFCRDCLWPGSIKNKE
jgi:hypothetical protein